MKFRKKPVVIEAIQWTGDNAIDVYRFTHGSEGIMTANVGDWIIRDVNDELYPCKPDIFEKTYERVEE